MRRVILLSGLLAIAFSALMPLNAFAASGNSQWTPLLEVAFEKKDLEAAVSYLIDDKNIPISDVIAKAREKGFGYTRIVDALIDTKSLSCEQVMIEALQNNAPPLALFDSKKISGDYGYTPELILKFLVKELRFMDLEEEQLGKEDQNAETRKKNLEIITKVCKSMIIDEDFTPFDVMRNLCLAEANNEVIAKVSKRLDVPQATTFKACPKHAEYGRAHISRELPQQAHIVIGVDHLTIDDDSGRGVISPKTP
ncbi:MAG: hypothetical protein C4518_20480 [Desulfobacteraceae bacterium]|nr:MAG: hypothetical protein C4518_20480 [Desulfobacteraceae bacterium]